MWYARFGEALACRDEAEAGIVRFKVSLRMELLPGKPCLLGIRNSSANKLRANASPPVGLAYSKALQLSHQCVVVRHRTPAGGAHRCTVIEPRQEMACCGIMTVPFLVGRAVLLFDKYLRTNGPSGIHSRFIEDGANCYRHSKKHVDDWKLEQYISSVQGFHHFYTKLSGMSLNKLVC